MSEYKYINQIPAPLLDSIVQNRCLPFIGAGFSKNAELPEGKSMLDWEELGKEYAKLIPDYEYTNAIDAISAYEYLYKRPSMVEKLKELLLLGQVKPGNVHKSFCQLQFDIVCTTNFDRLLESAFEQQKRPCNAIFNESQLSVASSRDEVTLLKIHGDIYHPDRIVATEEDYDKFLSENPLLSTFLSNLLITRTPLFVGYSLDDADFRQIWQIIKNRLGYLRRQAYVIKVDCTETERSRFERRGVQVVNIKGKSQDYPTILKELFDELKRYWNDRVPTYSESRTQSELSLPSESQNRLCFFSVPLSNMPFYKEYIFPIAGKYNFVPITADSVVSAGDNWMAKVSSLIAKAEFFVVEFDSSYTLYELSQIIEAGKKNVFVIKGDDVSLGFDSSIEVIDKPLGLMSNLDPFIEKVDKWFKKMDNKVSDNSLLEPDRLLEKKEYNAAVISVMVLLEVALRENIMSKKEFVPNWGLYQLLKLAMKLKIVQNIDISKIRDWVVVRNNLVHTGMQLNEAEAKMYVRDVSEMINKLKKRVKRK